MLAITSMMSEMKNYFDSLISTAEERMYSKNRSIEMI